MPNLQPWKQRRQIQAIGGKRGSKGKRGVGREREQRDELIQSMLHDGAEGQADSLAGTVVEHCYGFWCSARQIRPSFHSCFQDDLACHGMPLVQSNLKGSELLAS